MAMSLKYDQISPMQAAFDRLQAINAELDQKLQTARLQAKGWAELANQRLNMLETSDTAYKSQIEAYKYKLEATEKQVNAWRNDAIEQAMRVQGLVKERDQALDDAADMASRVQELVDQDYSAPCRVQYVRELEEKLAQANEECNRHAARIIELEDQGHDAIGRAKQARELEAASRELREEAAQAEVVINQLREERDQAKKQLIELERKTAASTSYTEYMVLIRQQAKDACEMADLKRELDAAKEKLAEANAGCNVYAIQLRELSNGKQRLLAELDQARREGDISGKAVHDLIDQNLQFEKKVEVLEAVKDRLRDEYNTLAGDTVSLRCYRKMEAELEKAKADNQAYFTQVIEANEFNRRLLRESEDRGIANDGLRAELEKAKATIESERQHHQNLNRDLIAWHESDQATIKRQVSRINQLFDEKLATPDERLLKQEMVDLRTSVMGVIGSIRSKINEAMGLCEDADLKTTDASDTLVAASQELDELAESIENT